MKKKVMIAAILLSMLTATSLTACSGGTTSSEDSSSSTEMRPATQATDSDSEKVDVLMAATINDTIDFKEYVVYTQSDGTKVYYANGKYLFVYNNTVVETREALTLEHPTQTVLKILDAQPDFDVSKDIDYYFYNADNEQVSYDPDSALTSDICYCLAEYVDWEDETETTGILHSVAFTYGDTPVKITSMYAVIEDTSGDTSTPESSEGGTSEADEESKADEESDVDGSVDEEASAEESIESEE